MREGVKLIYTVALPAEKGGPRPIRTLSISGVAPRREAIANATVRAAKYAEALWGKPQEVALTDAELEWGETK